MALHLRLLLYLARIGTGEAEVAITAEAAAKKILGNSLTYRRGPEAIHVLDDLIYKKSNFRSCASSISLSGNLNIFFLLFSQLMKHYKMNPEVVHGTDYDL